MFGASSELASVMEFGFKQQYLLHMFPQYGELRLTSGWDRSVYSLGHSCKFQRVSCLGSVTHGTPSSGRQPNFAALNRGRRLYSAGRPSRWALAHILVSKCCTESAIAIVWLWECYLLWLCSMHWVLPVQMSQHGPLYPQRGLLL